MPRESNPEIESRAHPHRYVRLDGLGRPYPTPELVRKVGPIPTDRAWVDCLARPQYRAALDSLFNASLRRAEGRRHDAILRSQIGITLIRTSNWFLRWEHILKKEAEQHDIECDGTAKPR